VAAQALARQPGQGAQQRRVGLARVAEPQTADGEEGAHIAGRVTVENIIRLSSQTQPLAVRKIPLGNRLSSLSRLGDVRVLYGEARATIGEEASGERGDQGQRQRPG
jgi:hypothetical protein